MVCSSSYHGQEHLASFVVAQHEEHMKEVYPVEQISKGVPTILLYRLINTKSKQILNGTLSYFHDNIPILWTVDVAHSWTVVFHGQWM